MPVSEKWFTLDEKVQRSDARRLRQRALPAGLTMHGDYSRDGGDARIRMHLSVEEISDILNGTQRAKIINAWRPFATVYNAPLVISDRKTIRQDDLIEVDFANWRVALALSVLTFEDRIQFDRKNRAGRPIDSRSFVSDITITTQFPQSI
ncbi:hypothetical protein EAF04_000054 [Stromatinia cepivora]|nr:hypothetical protein EAF04_000054 [Stromatinia cepivora]